ncbi:G-patch domain and KOW motifs-containing protein-like isoform X2 [Bombus affinis]|uniref:G-patch domain and KOW motifs-containing protein-like isoform X2 n=1 Tax=Bombus affinis TaxID=309941 RepID=UPI0021B82EAD|nr:G-patch domain and KOW motifs-containing protein-like isoform X2 [Bombus affinis]
MGLGADKVALQKKNTDFKKEEEEVKIEKGTFVKIIAGEQSNNYGQIEGFDDDAGRLIIKLALGGNIISIRKKYEEYKDKESKGLKQKMDRKRSMSPDPEDGEEQK